MTGPTPTTAMAVPMPAEATGSVMAATKATLAVACAEEPSAEAIARNRRLGFDARRIRADAHDRSPPEMSDEHKLDSCQTQAEAMTYLELLSRFFEWCVVFELAGMLATLAPQARTADG